MSDTAIPKTPKSAAVSHVLHLANKTPELREYATRLILEKADDNTRKASNQESTSGRREHPFNMGAVNEYFDFNTTHAACIETKRAATVGHRLRKRKVYDVLNPLCKISFQDVLDRCTFDFWNAGNGYYEVVHGDVGDPELITGIHHIPARNSWVHVEGTPARDFHFEVLSNDPGLRTTTRRFARFGDLEAMRARAKTSDRFDKGAKKSISEVIHWQFPNGVSQWYGRPEYFSAAPSIELTQVMTQREFNFFFNNGVPEFLLFLLGAKLKDEDWNAIKAVMQAGQGLRGGHLSGAFNLENPQLQVQLERLAMSESGGDKGAFSEKSQVTAMNIATAHQVPPPLAGILIPGRMGGTNEGPNAIMSFQTLKIAPAQKALCDLLASTLGSGVRFSSPKGEETTLTAEDFLGSEAEEGNGFHTITDQIAAQTQVMAPVDTMNRMKEPVAGSGRDLDAGLRRNGRDRAVTGGQPRTA